MKKLTILLMTMLIFAFFSGIAAAKEISVNPTSSIYNAVNNAASGDTIIVKPGIYSENIKVTTPNLIIKSESGNPENTIIKASPNTSVFNIAAINTTISGFRIESGETGIYLVRCSDCIITNNDLSDNRYGISLISSNNNEISGNRVNSNKMFGIHLDSSEGNTLSSNTVNSNTRGIDSITSNNNLISGNKALNNSQYGMWISQSHDNNISGNTVNECGNGVTGSGGIHLNSSSRNVISGNIVASNHGPGFFECPGCHNNRVYNNYINNVRNANINTRDTTWNIEKTSGRNIVGGKYIGGNFWGTPEGTGFSQTEVVDRDGDDIIDSAYIDDSGNISDYLPLVLISTPQSPILPIANLSASVTRGYAPLEVQFTDRSQNAVSRSWDINNDGTVDNTSESFVYVYQNPGNYTAKLTVSNENGTASKTQEIFVNKVTILPVADFSANVTSGYAPLSVLFTNMSQNAVSWSWDFENDGQIDSTDKNPVHTYNTPGNYTAELTVSNEDGNSSKTQEITVTRFTILPVADFSANVTNGCAPLSVLLTDKSQNATSRIWDIGNDRTVESTDPSIVYVFTSPGTYSVNLTAINENGTSSKITSIAVTKESSSSDDNSDDGHSHSSGGSGGGGGGGSPEPQTNVQVKELSKAQVSNGKTVQFDFTKNATCVVYVSFDAKKTAGKITTIAEQLKAKSTLVSVLDSGEVYKYFNLWVGNSGFATEKNIENPVVCFKIEKSWLQDKKIDQNSIILNRYSDKKWSQLPVKLLKEDDKYLYFTAETPGFSFFAITGKAIEKEKVAETKPSTDTSKLEKNNTASETETEQKTEQETGKDKTTSIPGFEILYAIVSFLIAFSNKKR
ncbi:MAG TPA: PGF-pre-PGF domain-containing protein [Methanosarcina sp.]|nr:PGF-pre-PGF domain-containing protein [Methanosarcina sp.]